MFSLYLHPSVTTREKALAQEMEKLFPTGVVFYRNSPLEEWKTDDPDFNANVVDISEQWMRLAIADMEAEMGNLYEAWDRTLAQTRKEKPPELVRAFHDEVVLQYLQEKEDSIRRQFEPIFPTGFSTEVQKDLLKRAALDLKEASDVRTETDAKELEYAPALLEATPFQGITEAGRAENPISRKKAAKKYPNGFDGLQRKYVDMSGYLAQADLTDRQRQCFSLRKEYDLSLEEVAGRLRIDRKTAYEHIHDAEKKLKLQFENRRDQTGRVKKAPLTE